MQMFKSFTHNYINKYLLFLGPKTGQLILGCKYPDPEQIPLHIHHHHGVFRVRKVFYHFNKLHPDRFRPQKLTAVNPEIVAIGGERVFPRGDDPVRKFLSRSVSQMERY